MLTLSHSSPAAAQPIAPEVAGLCNLVQNGGFEEGGEVPTFWARYPPDDEGNRQLRDTTTAHSGQASGLLLSTRPHEPGKAGIQWNRYGIPVEGGAALIVSFWVKTEGVAPIGCGTHFYDADGNHLGFHRIVPPGRADDWTYVRETVRIPDGAKTMGFAAYGADEGKTWFDDIAVICTPSTEAARGTPRLDGKLDDECWSEEGAITAFAVHTGEKLPTARVRAWLAYDDTHLYVAFHCPHPKGAELRAKATKRDGDTWLDDSIEVFLDPHHRDASYFQCCVNCLGVIRDSRQMDVAWQSGARAEVRRAEDAWSVELAIPFERLDLDLDVGTTWRLNLVRNDRVNGEPATWSLGGFHDPSRFGNVALAPDLSRFYRADLRKRLPEKGRERDRLLDELRRANLPEHAMADASEVVGEADEALETLRDISEDKAELPEGGWQGVRAALGGVSDTLAAARQAAITGLFRVGGEGTMGGFRVAIANSLEKIRRDGPVLNGEITREVRLEAARDETESFQLVVIPDGGPLAGVEVEAPALGGPGGELAVQWHRVGYVETAEPGYPTEYVGWWPDPLLDPGPFDVAADERQPLWFRVNVPADARPGTYEGKVTVRHGGDAVSVPVELRVRSFRLPRPGTLATAFGMYAWSLARGWFGKQPYEDSMPIEMFARWCEFLGQYRLTPKNMAREYITVARSDETGELEVDLSNLWRTVAPLALKYYAPYSFCLHRLPTAPAIRSPDNKHTPENAREIVKAIKEAWERQGLPREVYIYGYDEPHPDEYPFLCEAYAKVREVAPEYPIMQTIGDVNPQALVGLVDIWCPLSARLDSDFYAKRIEAGDTLWTYVCCGPKPPHANFFVDEPATDHRVLFWQTWQHGATGLLYWCLTIWDGLPTPSQGQPCFPEAPIHLKDHTTYKSFQTNGDGLLVYPGPDREPIPSIRLEVIRDGIEDYEYLALLARLIQKAEALPEARGPGPELLDEGRALLGVPESISRTLTDYTKDSHVIIDRRRQVGDMIERLVELLGEEEA